MKSRKELLQDFLELMIPEKAQYLEDIEHMIKRQYSWKYVFNLRKRIQEMQEVIDYLVKEIENEN